MDMYEHVIALIYGKVRNQLWHYSTEKDKHINNIILRTSMNTLIHRWCCFMDSTNTKVLSFTDKYKHFNYVLYYGQIRTNCWNYFMDKYAFINDII